MGAEKCVFHTDIAEAECGLWESEFSHKMRGEQLAEVAGVSGSPELQDHQSRRKRDGT